MTVLSDEPASRPISILLVEDDAPTSWRLQDAGQRAALFLRGLFTTECGRLYPDFGEKLSYRSSSGCTQG